jgi:hypothetical protein
MRLSYCLSVCVSACISFKLRNISPFFTKLGMNIMPFRDVIFRPPPLESERNACADHVRPSVTVVASNRLPHFHETQYRSSVQYFIEQAQVL